MRRALLCSILAGLAPAACTPSDPGDPAHPKLKPFPAGFLWGSATAPYQIEGGLHGADWYQWESTAANATRARADDGPRSYEYYEADNALAERGHHGAMRIGIDWSRLFPTRASFPLRPDPQAVAHYHAVLQSMKAHRLIPMVTLYHWALPTWLQDLTRLTDSSGWLDDTLPDAFAQLAGWAAKEYGEVELWVTLNEPVVNITAGYFVAAHPPLRSFSDQGGVERALRAARNMIYAHARAYDAIHAARPSARVSIAFHQRVFIADPAGDDETRKLHAEAARRLQYISNIAFLDAATKGNLDYDLDQKLDGARDKTADPALKNRLDWIGVNYYSQSTVQALGKQSIGPLIGLPRNAGLDSDNPKTEFGWDIHPAGFRAVLDEVRPYGLPIYITENGIADASDGMRPRFLIDHLYVLQQAIQDGLDVRGYFHWSLMDNFEWAGGYCPRFGLAAIDFNDPQRTRKPRPSFAVYQQIIDANRVDPALFKQFPDYPAPGMTCKGGG